MTEPRKSDFVQSLERGLAVIRAFDDEHRELTLSEVARATGLTRAAARRFLLTLVELGYVHFDDGRFSPRPRVLELGYAYLSSLSLPEVAAAAPRGARGRGERVVVDLGARRRRTSSTSPACPRAHHDHHASTVGTRLPAYATSMGRVLAGRACPTPELEELPRAGRDQPAHARARSRTSTRCATSLESVRSRATR